MNNADTGRLEVSEHRDHWAGTDTVRSAVQRRYTSVTGD